MACRADWYTRPLRRAFRGREGRASYALQFNPPVEPEECLLTTLSVVFGSVNTQGPSPAHVVVFFWCGAIALHPPWEPSRGGNGPRSDALHRRKSALPRCQRS